MKVLVELNTICELAGKVKVALQHISDYDLSYSDEAFDGADPLITAAYEELSDILDTLVSLQGAEMHKKDLTVKEKLATIKANLVVLHHFAFQYSSNEAIKDLLYETHDLVQELQKQEERSK